MFIVIRGGGHFGGVIESYGWWSTVGRMIPFVSFVG